MSSQPAPNPLASLPNPFDGAVVQDAWHTPAVDVASIHREPFEQCLGALESVAQRRPESILLFGPAGSGKTHLLARLQRHLVATSHTAPDKALRCVFVNGKLQTNAALLWQFVRRRLATDLLRKHEGLTQLQRLVAHQLAAARGEPPRQWVRAFRVLAGTDGESVTEYLAQVAQRIDIGRDLFVALDHLVHGRFVLDASAWLRGDSLPENVLDRLGLGREDEDREEAARQAVTALCRLAGETLPIVFCFDQIEALQTHRDDTDSLFRFGRVAADLSEADDDVLLISCIQSAFLDLLNASVRESDRDRIFKRRAFLDPLSREQVEALVVQRLDALEPLRELRAREGTGQFYPLSAEQVEGFAVASPCVPRRVIASAAAAFDELRRGLSAPPVDLHGFLEGSFRERRGVAIERGRPEESRDTLLHGLPMLWALRRPDSPPPSSAAGIDLVLGSAADPLGVVVCNETNMTSLASRLRKLVQRDPGEQLSGRRLVLLRDARLAISRSAKKTNEYLEELEARGVRVVLPSAEALAALEALRSLVSDARAGDLALEGQAVAESSVLSWIAGATHEDLVELFDGLAPEGERSGSTKGAAPEAPDPAARLARDLGDLLLRSYVVDADRAAEELGHPAADVLAVAQAHPERFGLLQGPPVVLFWHVPAEASLGEEA